MKHTLLFFLTLLLLPFAVFAQNKTTSSIQGVVTDAQGQPLVGANVVAIHKPSGTRYGAATRKNGHFTFKNVRTGGPYTVQVTFIGYNPQKKTITNIQLGNTATINFTLERGNKTLNQIAVTATVNPTFSKNRTGAKSHISQQSIDRTPQLNRSLSSYTSLSAHSTGGSSFGGTNNRYNNIKVDGSTLNDVFGLSGNGLPGGQAGVESPVSISAIKEINIDVAPFAVTNNNFNGAQINAITKSGNNEYHGQAYFQYQNQSLEGKYMLQKDYGQKSAPTTDFRKGFYGLSLGGPIIKNKLFFFVNGEIERQSSPVGGGLPGTGVDNAFDVSKTKMDRIQNILQKQYGHNPGSYTNSPSLVSNNNKVLAKLNWNINEKNKFMLRYNHVDSKVGDGISRSRYSYDFSNRKYYRSSKQNSFVAELNSDFSNNTSNTFRIGYTRIRFGRNVAAERFPQVDINMYNLHGHGKSYDVLAGIDRFSQANQLGQDLYQLTDNFTYILGNNEFTFGTSNHLYHFSNLFVQDQYGSYIFRSTSDSTGTYSAIDNLERGNPYEYHLSYLKPNGKPKADFSALQVGFYAQDKWTATDRFTMTFGLRIDIPFLLQKPTYNKQVAQTTFQGKSYNTQKVASGNILWSPRLGFNWQATEGDRATQVRGGIGIFSGAPPFVWISNQYSNTGADYYRIFARNSDGLGKGVFSGNPDDQPKTLPGAETQQTEVDLMSHDFKYPQSLKMDLAVDHQLPGGITATIEGIYTKDINYITYSNINLKQVGTSKYGRPLYGEVKPSSFGDADGIPAYIHPEHFNNVILLDNTDKGYRYSLSLEFKKQFETGLSFDVAYTYNRAKTVNNGTSSRAISNWQYTQNKDVNHTRLGTAAFEKRNHLLARVSYAFFYGRGSSTTLSLVYQGFSGHPVVWLYNGNANGDTRYDNDLVYVPHQMKNSEAIGSDKREVVVASLNGSGKPNRDALNEFINSHPGLDKYRGQIVPRYSGRAPFENFLDLKVSQKILTVKGQSVELEASIFNLPNLLNYKWGAHYTAGGFGEQTAWTLQQYVDQDYINNHPDAKLTDSDIGKPIINFDPKNGYKSSLYTIDNIPSRWRLQFGVKYNF
jgi:Fe-S cluster biosynthesis and repair protein YggX